MEVMKIVYWHSKYNLFVLNMGLNTTCAKSRNLYVYASLTVYMYCIWTGNMIREQR